MNSEGETKRGTVLDSIAHGGTKMDIIQEYIKFAKKRYQNYAEKMEALLGTSMNSNSLTPQYSWMCYADIVRDGEELRAKLWEFKKMVRDALNKLAFNEDEDEPIEVDPFTDPDEGLPVMVKYLKNPNKKKGENYYEVNFAKKPVARPLSDSELEYFANLKPLSEILSYTIKDFDRALEGLQVFDEENNFELFSDDDWLEIVEKVKSQYDVDSEEEEEKPKKKTVVKQKPVVEEEEEETEEKTDEEDVDEDSDDEYADMDRKELKEVIKENGLDITVKKSMSDDDIREAIREAMKKTNDSADEEDSDEEEDEEDEKPAAKISLEDFRKKLAGKK